MSEAMIVKPNEAELDARVAPAMRAANELVVTSPDAQAVGLQLLSDIRRAKKLVEEQTKPFVDATNRAHKEAVAFRDRFVGPLKEADALVTQKCAAWDQQQREIARQEEARLRAIEIEKQEKQRELDAAMAETEEEAEDALTAPLPEPVVTVAPAVGRVEGVSTKTRYKAEVVDKAAFVRWCLDSKPPQLFMLEISMTYLNSRATNEREDLNIPGVRAVPVVGYAVR